MTTAKQKIEMLTNSWYGFTLFTGVLTLFNRGLGVTSLITTAIGVCFQLAVVWFIGRKLQNRSGFTRTLLILVSGLMTVFGTVGTAKLGYAAITDFSLTMLFAAFFAGTTVVMHARSFRTLMDDSVKVYFNKA